MKTSENYWKLFNILPGKKFEFLVNSKPSTDGAWTVTLEPLTAAVQSGLEYDRWVADRKAMVAAEIMGSIYRGLLRRMELDKYRVFEKEYVLSKLEKVGRILAQLLKLF